MVETIRGEEITTAVVPQGSFTFFIRAKDTSGNLSSTTVTKDFTVTVVTDVLETSAQHPAWAGDLDNLIVHTNTNRLLVESQDLASGDNYDIFDNYVVNPYPLCAYYTEILDDLGFIDTVYCNG